MIYLKQEEAAERKGSMNTIIKNAKRRMNMYREGVDKPSTFDLGTTVHELVEELLYSHQNSNIEYFICGGSSTHSF